jgi:AcrR family transcriptional regulator
MTAHRSAPYHHGDLRRALITGAVAAIEKGGPNAMSLRQVAREAGVTHAAATHHFGDKAGLLTAVAAEGYRLLADELVEVQRTRASFLEVGVAYVRFAVTHRAHFEVMFRPELYHPGDAELGAARATTAAILYGARHGRASDEQVTAGVAAWALVHGVATLWLNGSLPARLGNDPEDVARRIAPYLRTRRR